jgi:hypothetical protein
MRIRFNINPIGQAELALISLINGYPNGLRSELVRRLIVIGYNFHAHEDDILNGINIHNSSSEGGTMCKFNISALLPSNDPAVKAFNIAKSLNSLVKPLYLNKLLKTGYLFETGEIKNPTVKLVNAISKTNVSLQEAIKPSVTPDAVDRTTEVKNNLSLKDNPSLKLSLRNLSS